MLNTTDRWERPAKYAYVVHAEANAVAMAAKAGGSTDGAIAFVNLFPCATCAKLLIQSGVRVLVTRQPDTEHKVDARVCIVKGVAA